MRNVWATVKVREVAASTANSIVGGPFGSNLVSSDYVLDGVPVIRGQNMGERWVSGPFAYVSPQKARSLSANKARPGDIVFTQRGTLGQVSIIPHGEFEEYLVSQSQMKLTVDPSVANSTFLYYVFSSESQKEYIRQNAIQTGVPHTNLGILRETPIPLPSLVEQQRIANILGSLDDKIELNNRMAATLEEIARAIFKSWFIDFDPVRAKAKGNPTDLPPEIEALFPDTLTDDGVPTGWKLRPLDSFATFLNGLALQKYPPVTVNTLPVIKIAQLRKMSTADSDLCGDNLPHDYVVEDGDILFSWSGSLECVVWTGGQGGLNQHLFKVTSNEVPDWFIYFSILEHLPWFRGIAASKATTMGHIQRKHLTEATIAYNSEVIAAAGSTMTSLYERKWRLQLESRSLATIRDALVPKLISDEITLPG